MGRQLYRASRLYFARLAKSGPWSSCSRTCTGWTAPRRPCSSTSCHSRPRCRCFSAASPGRRSTVRSRGCRSWPAASTPSARARSASSRSRRPRVTTLASQLISSADLPATLRKAILAKAEGNPFFVEEIVQSLIDLGGLVRDEATGSYRVTDQAGAHRHPRHPARRHHGARRSPRRRPQAGPAPGRGHRAQLLLPPAWPPSPRPSASSTTSLAGLQARELVLEKAREPELEYIFKHALGPGGHLREHREAASARAASPGGGLDRVPLRRPPRRLLQPARLPLHQGRGLGEGPGVPLQGRRPGGHDRRRRRGPRALRAGHGRLHLGVRRASGTRSSAPPSSARWARPCSTGREHERAREHLFRALALLGRPLPAARRAPCVAPSPGSCCGSSATASCHGSCDATRLRESSASSTSRCGPTTRSYGWTAERTRSAFCLALLLALNQAESVRLDWSSAASLNVVGYVFDMIPFGASLASTTASGTRSPRRRRMPFALGHRALDDGHARLLGDGRLGACRSAPAARTRTSSRPWAGFVTGARRPSSWRT